MSQTALNAMSIVGMAFFWKFFRSSTGVTMMVQAHENVTTGASDLWTMMAYLMIALAACLVAASPLVRKTLVGQRGLLITGTLATLCLWSPWRPLFQTSLPDPLATALLICSLSIYALAFAAAAGAWAALLARLAHTDTRVPLFVVAISLLLDLVLSLADVVAPPATMPLSVLAPLISAYALVIIRVRAKSRDPREGISRSSFGTPRGLAVGIVCMLVLSIVAKELVGPVITAQAFDNTPLIKNIITIMELALVVSICLFTSDIGSFLRLGWLVLSGLFLIELLATALFGGTAAQIALISLFTLPVCFEMHALQFIVARHPKTDEDAARMACLFILIPEMVSHIAGQCLISELGNDAGTWLTSNAQMIAYALGTGVVICIFFTVSLLAFRKAGEESMAVEPQVGLSGSSGSVEPSEGAEPPLKPESPSNSPDAHVVLEELAQRGGLTPRERDIAGLLYLGYSNKRIAELRFVSVNTVQTHIQNCYRKLGIHTRQELIDMVGDQRKL